VSRIGRLPIPVPGNVEIKIEKGMIWVKGPKGELSAPISEEMVVEQQEGQLVVKRPSDSIKHRALHGLTRSIINNLVQGVTQGFTKSLEIIGVGYKAEKRGSGVVFNLGYSHPIYFVPPKGITVDVPAPTKVVVSGIDKVLVGQVAAKIRSFRPPEPYKGKGIRYEGEEVRRKAGKTAG
jgi:large subunit ribosomal protein L6